MLQQNLIQKAFSGQLLRLLTGEKSLVFNVNVYDGTNTSAIPVGSGDDDAPCYRISAFKK